MAKKVDLAIDEVTIAAKINADTVVQQQIDILILEAMNNFMAERLDLIQNAAAFPTDKDTEEAGGDVALALTLKLALIAALSESLDFSESIRLRIQAAYPDAEVHVLTGEEADATLNELIKKG